MATKSGAVTPKVRTCVRVLVVDDDLLFRYALRSALEDEGHNVLEAPDGVIALDILRTVTDPMVVITDHNMPRLDGPSLVSFILDDPRLALRHQFLYLTAANRMLAPAFARQLDLLGVRVFRKPFDLGAFLDAVAEAATRLPPALSPHPPHE
jgi:two-component system cell cycle response regulator CpdR